MIPILPTQCLLALSQRYSHCGLHNEIFKLYPDEGLFSFSMKEAGGVVSYGKLIEDEMSDFLLSQLSDAVSSGKFFQCLSQA